MKSIRLNAELHLTASGKQRRFSILAYSGGTLRVDGFAYPVVVDLAGLETPNSIPIILDHIPSVETTLGQTSDTRNDGKSLVLAGVVTGQSERVLAVIAQHDAGHTWQASIGCSVETTQDVPAGDQVTVNGQTFVGPIIVARRSVLRETSILPMGADSTTSVNLAAAAAKLGNSSMSFEDWVTSLGLDASTLTPEALAVLQTAYDGMPADGDMPAADSATAAAVLSLRANTSAELTRQSQILATCTGYPHIANAAIQGGWGVTETENHILKAKARQMTPTNFARSAGATMTRDTLSAGLMIRAGQESLAVKAYGAQSCDIARGARLGNLVDVAAAALLLAGHNRHEYRSDSDLIRAAFSTSSLPTILSDAVGKTLVEAYQETTSDWRLFCHIGDARDFKDQTGVRPAAIAGLEQLGAGGNIKHGALTEEDTYEWSVGTFAKMLSVTRTTIINDDVGFISELAPMLGQAAGRSLNDLIWSTILGGQTAAFFASAKSNLAEAGSALAVGSLGAGVSAMRSHRDSQGFDVGIQPAVLVVTPALELTARALLNSAEVLGTSGPNGNPVQGIVKNLAVEPRLSNSTRFTGTSTTQWYLFGGPMSRPVTVGFLRGAQVPTVETEDADFNTLGIQMRVFHDYGVALADPKAAYKATGAA